MSHDSHPLVLRIACSRSEYRARFLFRYQEKGKTPVWPRTSFAQEECLSEVANPPVAIEKRVGTHPN